MKMIYVALAPLLVIQGLFATALAISPGHLATVAGKLDTIEPVGEACWLGGLATADAPGTAPTRRLKQLTASPCAPTVLDISDPSPPFDDNSGHIVVFGAGLISWSGASPQDAWRSFLRGAMPTYAPLDLHYANGVPLLLTPYVEEGWDATVEFFNGLDPILYTGVMTPPTGQEHATYDADNRTRRTRSFHFRDGMWTMDQQTIFTDFPDTGWMGHNYGHQFFKDDSGVTWMFYERVSMVVNDSPVKTEIFARRFTPPSTLYGPEVSVYAIPNPAFNANVRANGNLLAEGPRPFAATINGRRYYFVSFSSSDWDSPKYGVNMLWSRQIDGPYSPVLTPDGSDLLDLAAGMKRRHADFTFGPGRASFFQDPSGAWWTIFHAAIRTSTNPSPTYRNFFLAPVEIGLVHGVPRIEILEQD